METWEIEWSFTTITLKLYVVSGWILVRNGGHGGVSHRLTTVIVGQMYEFNHTAKVEIEVYLGSTKHFYVLRLMDMFQRYVIKKIYRCTVNTCPNSKLTPNLKYSWYFSRGTLQILIFLVKQYSSRRVFSGRRFARRQVCPMTATWPSSG